jgi:hypothetical protein
MKNPKNSAGSRGAGQEWNQEKDSRLPRNDRKPGHNLGGESRPYGEDYGEDVNYPGGYDSEGTRNPDSKDKEKKEKEKRAPSNDLPASQRPEQAPLPDGDNNAGMGDR